MSVSLWLPWRSVWVPRVLTAAALVVGLPLFLRSPPWCDITLYQMAARNLLTGGVHYRDLFDTNLPGFVWAMTALSAAFGPSVVAVRAVDLLVVFGVVVLIDRLAKWAGATPAARWWALAGAALFYPYTVEMCHAQRDTWMALPGLAAVALRVRRGTGCARPTPPTPLPTGSGENSGEASSDLPNGTGVRRSFSPLPAGRGVGLPDAGRGVGEENPSRSFKQVALSSFCEGLLWGAGVWMKPHIALMALAVWLLTARRLAGASPRPWRAAGADLLGNLLGGLAAAVPGLIWLVASGAWGPFLDVFLVWNPGYMKLAIYEFDMRVDQELFWFPPWSLGLVPTVPLALLSVLDAAPWSSRRAAATPERAGPIGYWLPRLLWDKRAGADARFVRGTLGGLYLVWAAQAFLVQRGFQYAHIPETLLMLGVWAAHRWAWVPIVLLWLALAGGAWLAADAEPNVNAQLMSLSDSTRERYLPRHALTETDRLRQWPECWRTNLTDAERYALWDRLRLHPPHEASIGWVELAEVATFLRAQGASDGEVIGWFDSPHAVYLILDLEPGFRFMHVHTAIAISLGEDPTGLTGRKWVLDELKQAPRAKYAVSDVLWTAMSAGSNEALRREFTGPARAPDNALPVNVPYPNEFPWNQPTVFRTRNGTGRYIVHRIVTPDDDPR
jgi:hypothetical protein